MCRMDTCAAYTIDTRCNGTAKTSVLAHAARLFACARRRALENGRENGRENIRTREPVRVGHPSAISMHGFVCGCAQPST
jgi:hypothetical protein